MMRLDKHRFPVTRNVPKVGYRTPTHKLRKLDGRTREARRLRTIENELVADHLRAHGSAPTRSARMLVDRTAVDMLRLELLDGKLAEGSFSERDGRIAHALRNSVRLALRELGLLEPTAAPTDPVETLERHLTRRGAA